MRQLGKGPGLNRHVSIVNWCQCWRNVETVPAKSFDCVILEMTLERGIFKLLLQSGLADVSPTSRIQRQFSRYEVNTRTSMGDTLKVAAMQFDLACLRLLF